MGQRFLHLQFLSLLVLHGGRIVIQLNRFIYLGEPFEVILEEQETNPMNYDEIMNSDDAILW